MDQDELIANAAEFVAGKLEEDVNPSGPDLRSVDWNDLGEVTIQFRGRTYRMALNDITDEE